MLNCLHVLVWLLPASRAKNQLLRAFGHMVGSNVRIGSVLVLGIKRASVGAGTTIAGGSVFRGLTRMQIGEDVNIGGLNTFTADVRFRALSDDAGTLTMQRGSMITSRHLIDCTGTLELGEFSAIGGHRCTIETSYVDFETNSLVSGRVRISERAGVTTNCTITTGVSVPPDSALAANATLYPCDIHPEPGIYSGVPAVHRPLRRSDQSWFSRRVADTTVLRVDEELGRIQSEPGRVVRR